jgi:Permease MlaE
VDCGVGLFKSVGFGALAALAGCLRGMQCGRSAASVGAAATSAVVTGIVWIIASDGIFAVLTETMLAVGNPKTLRDTSPEPKICAFLTRGKDVTTTA